MTDVPALPDEDWMPPLNTFRWSVKFYYTSANSGAGYWQSEGKYWTRDVEHFTSSTGQLKKAVSDIVAPSDSEEQKARKIYAAVMKLNNTDYIQQQADAGPRTQRSKAVKDASGVLKQGGGSANDLALLYIALARAAGLKAWPMQVVNRDRATFEETYLSTDQFDDYIAIVVIDGKDVFVDPGQKGCSFGALHWKHEIAKGFRLSEKGATLSETPAGAPKLNNIRRTADLTVDEHGSVQGTAQFELSGQEAMDWRQLASQASEAVTKSKFGESMQALLPAGVQIEVDHFNALDDYDSNLVAVAKISGNLGSITGKHAILPAVFFESRANHPFATEVNRATPIDLEYATMEQDDVTYHLPAGFAVESTLRPVNVSWTDHGTMRVTSDSKDGAIHVSRTFVRNFAILDAGNYSNLRYFYQQVAAADQQQLVLTNANATPAAKGN